VSTFQMIPLASIDPSPTNPRKHFDEAELDKLADSIKAVGVLQPIVVRPKRPSQPLGTLVANHVIKNLQGIGVHSLADLAAQAEAADPEKFVADPRSAVYAAAMRAPLLQTFEAKTLSEVFPKKGQAARFELVAGERRLRAAKLAGLAEIPATVKELTDVEVATIQTIENDQRSDIKTSERVAAYANLVKLHGSIDDAAAKIGRSPSLVRGFLSLKDCPIDLMTAVDEGKVYRTVAELVCRLPTREWQKEAARCVLWGHTDPNTLNTDPGKGEILSFRETKELIQTHYQRQLKGAPFSPSDKKLHPDAGSCKDCPKRVGNARLAEPEAFEGTRDDVCLDPACYREKCDRQKLKHDDAAIREKLASRTALPTIHGDPSAFAEGLDLRPEPAPASKPATANNKERATDRKSASEARDLDERYDRLLLGELAVSTEGLFGAVLPKGNKSINAVLRIVAAEFLDIAEAQMVTDLIRERRGVAKSDELEDSLTGMDGDQLFGLVVELITAMLMDVYQGRTTIAVLAKALDVNPKAVEKRAAKEIAAEAKAKAKAKAKPPERPTRPTNEKDGRLWDALHSTEGAAKRWDLHRLNGLADDSLKGQIGYEFGTGGSSGPGKVYIRHQGGSDPAIWFGLNAKAALKGKPLVGAVRRIMAIPIPKAEPSANGTHKPAKRKAVPA
jgi:ParB/RepB/Spo0J family partition protein